jgi:hypothetical protein
MLIAALLLAAQLSPAPPSPAERRQVIDVGDPDVIEASPLGPPDHVVNMSPHHRGFRSLIRVRQSFARELLSSEAQLK